jgi:hypothetical protein
VYSVTELCCLGVAILWATLVIVSLYTEWGASGERLRQVYSRFLSLVLQAWFMVIIICLLHSALQYWL